jgi:hypothetical protein
MKARHVLVVVLALETLATVAAAPAAAQETPANATTPEGTEQIDRNTRLISAEYDEESGEAVVTIESDTLQDVTLTDASGLLKGGETAQRTVTLRPGERTTVTIPATKSGGYVVVAIATRTTLYGEPIETSADVFQGSATWETVQAGAVGGGVGVLALTGVIAWRMRSGGRSKRRRIS